MWSEERPSNTCLASQITQTNPWPMGAAEPEHLLTVPFSVPHSPLEVADQGLCYIYFWLVIKKDLDFHLLKIF